MIRNKEQTQQQQHRRNSSKDAVLVTGPRLREIRDSTLSSTRSTADGGGGEIGGPSTESSILVEHESYRDVSTEATTANGTAINNSTATTTAAATTAILSTTSNPIRRFLETSFLGGSNKPPEEQELEELESNTSKASRTPARSSAQHAAAAVAAEKDDSDHDYYYDDDDDAELKRHYFNDGHGCSTSSTTATSTTAAKKGAATTTQQQQQQQQQQRNEHDCHLLGKTYHTLHDYDARRSDESALFWFTYRCDFPCIAPYGITSDAGWGCMLRALQMMMGQTLRLHYKSRDWRPPQQLAMRRQDPFVRSVLTWFADFASTKESLYSLHNMVGCGLMYDQLPGEWYGPGTACYVLRDLVEMHVKQQQMQQQQQQRNNNKNNHHNPKMFRVHVASGGTVYREEIDQLVASEALAARRAQEQQRKDNEQLAHPLDLASWEEEALLVDGTTITTIAAEKALPWDTSLLLLIPLRLGLKSFNSDYCQAIAHTFSLPQSVGILGGRPRGARWFYGAHADGSKILGLDPHTVQSAPRRRAARVNGQPSSVVEFSDDYLQSVHTTYTETFPLAKLDPSIALGFYCRNRADLDSVLSQLQEWKKDHPGTPDLFTVADKAPDYEAAVVAANSKGGPATGENFFESMLDETTTSHNKEEDDDDDDDEFVLL